MKTLLRAAAVAALLTGSGLLAAQAADTAAGGRVHMAQQDSPGDGLDGSPASREGNARPGEKGSAGLRRMKPSKSARKTRSRM